jgi:hypothetical protein
MNWAATGAPLARLIAHKHSQTRPKVCGGATVEHRRCPFAAMELAGCPDGYVVGVIAELSPRRMAPAAINPSARNLSIF